MRISYLELKNYRKFRDLKLQFPDGVVGILGLNGSGKTTIIEAIAWALFGNEEEVVRTSRESIRFSGAKSSDSVKAVLEFELDDAEYRVEREMGGRSLAMKATLHQGTNVIADGDKAVKATIQKLIGMDYKSFFTSVFARQKELDELQELQPAKRKEIVLRMLRIDGLDSAIRSIRSDLNSASDKIRGAESVLTDADGNDREKSVTDRSANLTESYENAEKSLKGAQEAVNALTKETADIRDKKESLRKDFEALGVATAELNASRKALADQKASEESLSRRIRELEGAFGNMAELKRAEEDWRRASAERDSMELEKERFDRREHLLKDKAAIDTELESLKKSVSEAESSRQEEKALEEGIDDARKTRSESDLRKGDLVEAVTKARARIGERTDARAKDRAKLAEIERAGEDGICPTCERHLHDTYPLLVRKLRSSIESAEEVVGEQERLVEEGQGEMHALENKMQALERKTRHLEDKLTKVRHAIARAESMNEEMKRVMDRLKEKTRAIAELGDVRYSPGRHSEVKESFERLSKGHEEFLKLSEKQNQLDRAKADLAERRETVKRIQMEGETLSAMVRELDPKKPMYEAALNELERKSEELSAAKERAGDAKAIRERALAEIDSARRELDEIRRLKEVVTGHRARADELGALEDVFVSFKDHLIGRIAPTLGEMTSEILDLMTDGKYTEVALDENYRMSIEDDGEFHPLDRFSGGEGDIANLSLRLAISRVVSERTGANQVNFLILDEIFGSLDPSRKRSVMIALSGLSTQFRQVMLITHIDDVKDLMSNVVSVEELPDGTSTARIVS
ncbi:MAG TPA: SMC family ATPase [Thermoplasmata archaeon]|nr:SMC family ATPase [Thermoplasmata archaeon]